MKHKALAVLAIASAPINANELDSLITTSQEIRSTFAYGVQAIGGMMSYTNAGGIAPTGTVDQGLISKVKQDAYNNAVLQFQQATYTWDPNADQYFQEQSQQAMTTLSQQVDNYVDAARAVVEVVTINEMAENAQNAPDARESIALQEYIEVNDVLLDDQEVNTYNESLQAVEQAAQTAAAYMAVANDPSLIQTANDSARTMNVTYQESSQSYFDAGKGVLTIEWAGQDTTMTASLDLAGYFKTDLEILNAGVDSLFYVSSPVGGCWFIEDPIEKESCIYGS